MRYTKREIKEGIKVHLIKNDNFKTDFTVVFLPRLTSLSTVDTVNPFDFAINFILSAISDEIYSFCTNKTPPIYANS